MAVLNLTVFAFLVQCVIHSLLALVLVEAGMRIWQVHSAAERFRFRLLILVLPLLMFPSFQLLNPLRGGLYFSQDRAIFSSVRWLELELGGRVQLVWIFVFVLLGTSVLTLLQEVVPILRSQRAGESSIPVCQEPTSELFRQVQELSRRFGVQAPRICLLEAKAPVLYTDGNRPPSLVVSDSLLESLDPQQLRAALAHEFAHIVRRSQSVTLAAFLLRMLQFFNPVSLLVFRRLVQDDEQVCDDLTVAATRDPEALASVLALFFAPESKGEKQNSRALPERVAFSSHNLLLRERIERLKEGRAGPLETAGWVPFGLTVLSIVVLCFWVV